MFLYVAVDVAVLCRIGKMRRNTITFKDRTDQKSTTKSRASLSVGNVMGSDLVVGVDEEGKSHPRVVMTLHMTSRMTWLTTIVGQVPPFYGMSPRKSKVEANLCRSDDGRVGLLALCHDVDSAAVCIFCRSINTTTTLSNQP